MSEILAEVRRGSYVECVHRGSIAVVDPQGALVASVGDPDYYTFMRSSAKPIQALAIVESGAYEAFGFTLRELAVMCASHAGESFHVEAVRSILTKLGLTEKNLQCGTHAPYHELTAAALAREGRAPTTLHCNCSGKHAGMLALARHMGWDVDDYWRPEHPVQQLCLRNVAEVAGYPASKIGVAVDGCGVSVFALPLRHMARAFARLANVGDPATSLGPERAKAAGLVVKAMRTHPEMVSGTDRLDTVMMKVAPVVAKGGAEGVHCAGVLGKGFGYAIKVDDGNSRAARPAAVRTMEALGCLGPEAQEALKPFAHAVNTNNRREIIGSIEAVFELRRPA